MELSAFFTEEGYNLCAIEIWPLCVFLCHFDSTGFNMYTMCLKMSSEPLCSCVFNNSHSDPSGLFLIAALFFFFSEYYDTMMPTCGPLLHFAFSNNLLKITPPLEHHHRRIRVLYSGNNGAESSARLPHLCLRRRCN